MTVGRGWRIQTSAKPRGPCRDAEAERGALKADRDGQGSRESKRDEKAPLGVKKNGSRGCFEYF